MQVWEHGADSQEYQQGLEMRWFEVLECLGQDQACLTTADFSLLGGGDKGHQRHACPSGRRAAHEGLQGCCLCCVMLSSSSVQPKQPLSHGAPADFSALALRNPQTSKHNGRGRQVAALLRA